jgi:sirohydrochlorin ferrochelatase
VPVPPLVLVAHGSEDPRFGEVAESVAALVAAQRPDVEVRLGYLEHGRPVEAVADPETIVVPLLLSSGYHVRTEIPAC